MWHLNSSRQCESPTLNTALYRHKLHSCCSPFQHISCTVYVALLLSRAPKPLNILHAWFLYLKHDWMLHVFLSMILLPSAAWLETGFRRLLSDFASDHVALVSICLTCLASRPGQRCYGQQRWWRKLLISEPFVKERYQFIGQWMRLHIYQAFDFKVLNWLESERSRIMQMFLFVQPWLLFSPPLFWPIILLSAWM